MEYATPAWSPWQAGDCELLEKVQRISGYNGTYEEKLKQLNLQTLSQRRFRADMIETYKILNNISNVNPEVWFTRSNPNRVSTRLSVPNPERSLSLCQHLFYSPKWAHPSIYLYHIILRSSLIDI